jgi:hypothetical protein
MYVLHFTIKYLLSVNDIRFEKKNTNQLEKKTRIGGIMVSVLASSVVDHGFEPQSGQTKD